MAASIMSMVSPTSLSTRFPEAPSVAGGVGISTGRVIGIAIGRGRLALGAGNHACRTSSLGVWGRIEPMALLAPHPLHM